MARLKISREATADLDEIWLHIAALDINAADRSVDSIIADYKQLARHPFLGRLRPELHPELRSWARGNYVIFYIAAGEFVEIVRVLHGARDLPSLFQ
jgi:toxin ParE1/3/4